MGRVGRQHNWVRDSLDTIASVAPPQPVLDRSDRWHPYPAPVVSEEPSRPGPSRAGWNQQPLRVVEGHPDLWAFLKLADAPDSKILLFAQRWGPLGICVHGLPMLHGGQCQPLRMADRVWLPDEVRFQPPQDGSFHDYWEPLESWRFYTRQFRAVLAIAAAATADRAPDVRHVADAFPPRLGVGSYAVQLGTAFAPPSAGDLRRVEDYMEGYSSGNRPLFGRLTVSNTLRRLSQEAGLSLDFPWRPNEPALRVEMFLGDGFARLSAPSPTDVPFTCAGALFPFLVSALVAAAQRADGLVHCAGCGEVMGSPTGRKLRRDGTHYCIECKPEADRVRSRENKRRQRSQAASVTLNAPRTCARLGCVNSLLTSHAGAKYCSNSCRQRAYQVRKKPARTPTDTPTAMNASELA